MSKIIKNKKQIVNRKLLKKKLFQISIYFLNEVLEFSKNRYC